jgi:hypothetical protein
MEWGDLWRLAWQLFCMTALAWIVLAALSFGIYLLVR